MTSQTGNQITTRHLLPNISRRKTDQAMKLGQLIKQRWKMIKSASTTSFKNHAENKTVGLVQYFFLLFKKAVHDVKTGGKVP